MKPKKVFMYKSCSLFGYNSVHTRIISYILIKLNENCLKFIYKTRRNKIPNWMQNYFVTKFETYC